MDEVTVYFVLNRFRRTYDVSKTSFGYATAEKH